MGRVDFETSESKFESVRLMTFGLAMMEFGLGSYWTQDGSVAA
jgi:hypothetical protein